VHGQAIDEAGEVQQARAQGIEGGWWHVGARSVGNWVPWWHVGARCLALIVDLAQPHI
jgi:hypothetical protein